MNYPWAYTMEWIKPKPYSPSDEPEMRPLAWNPEKRPKPYTIEQLRTIRRLRAEAGKLGILLPPLPCPLSPCMACDVYREYWDKKLAEQLPVNLKLL